MLQPANAPLHDPLAAPHFRIWPGPLANIFGEETRAQIARRAAVNMAAFAPLSWRVNARGPDALDDLGFVRICVQAALDWNPTRRRADWVDPIADALLAPSAAPHRRHNPNTMADLCTAWGLQKVDLKGRRAGDVILYPISAHGAACGILIDRREPTQGPDRVALMAPGKIPEIHARHGFDHIPCAAFTWPEEA